jgi:hypothetical protein
MWPDNSSFPEKRVEVGGLCPYLPEMLPTENQGEDREVEMKAQDTTYSDEVLKDCIAESADAREACRLADQKIRALEKKLERLSAKLKSD